jgi:hypothetical protein
MKGNGWDVALLHADNSPKRINNPETLRHTVRMACASLGVAGNVLPIRTS